MVFPVALFRRIPQIRPIMDTLIGTEVMHWIAHSVLFAGLVILLAYAFKLPLTLKNVALLLFAVLIVGAAQEAFQLIATKHRPPGFPELFDLGVDMIGGLIGIGLLYLKRSTRQRIRVGY
ncbi:MAG: hypothetical protein DWQ07_22485 [Chloroflexi bacterium]|nr:MAG: hypothetical protein DWQ07_22485 [Chloroflexota bacterium]MBL1193917.1 hypothetical protein [Chloroflexota bacterium]